MKIFRGAPGAAVGSLLFGAPGNAQAQTIEALPSVTPIAEARLRYDKLDQDGQSQPVETVKLRLLLGGEAKLAPSLKGLVELEAIEALYDNQADRPSSLRLSTEAFDLNRAQLSWTGLPDTEIVLGRQAIILNNARFVGNGETRQNDQTFDALKVVNRSFAPVTLTYAYIAAAYRPARQVSTSARLESDSHLLQADFDTRVGHVSVYSYLLDFRRAATQSSASVGIRLSGSRRVRDGIELNYAAEYAHQTEYGGNPGRFGLSYAQIESGLSAKDWSVTGSVERLDGDGQRGFLAPLSSEYGFHGWSDAIFNAPPDGLLDVNIKATARLRRAPIGDGLLLTAAAFALSSADGSRRYGRELDFSASTMLNPRLTLDARAAVFDAQGDDYVDRSTVRIALRWKL